MRCSEKVEQFCKKDATVDDVIDAEEAALLCLYSGKEGDNLDGLRYAKFCDKVTINKVHISPQTLPPTSAAARYHSMRVYLQVQQWLGVCNMKETNLGWMTKDENLVPVMYGPSSSTGRAAPAQSGVFPCMRSVPRYRMFQQHRG